MCGSVEGSSVLVFVRRVSNRGIKSELFAKLKSEFSSVTLSVDPNGPDDRGNATLPGSPSFRFPTPVGEPLDSET